MQDRIQLTVTLKYYARDVLFENMVERVVSDIVGHLFKDIVDNFKVARKIREAGYEELANAWKNDKIDDEDVRCCIYLNQATPEYIRVDNAIVFTVTYMLDLKELEELVNIRRRQQELSYDAEHFKQLLKGVILYTSACCSTQQQLEQLTAMGFEEPDLRYFGFKDHDLAEFYKREDT